jgi:hypothetical protein
MLINFQGYSYLVERLENEVDKSYELRCWYVANYQPKSKEDFKTALKMSKLYVNHKLLHNKYSDSITSMFMKTVPLCF